MKRIHQSTVPFVVFTLFLSSVLCCCIGKTAFAGSSPMPACHQHKKAPVSQTGVHLAKADTKTPCECSKVQILAAAVDSNVEFKSLSVSHEQGKVFFVSFASDRSVDLSAVGFSPQYFSSQKLLSLPLYLQDSVLRI